MFSSSFGGPVTVVRSIAKELAKKHEVTVYTTTALNVANDSTSTPVQAKIDGYTVNYYPRVFTRVGFNISPTMMLALKYNLNNYDIVHLHSWRHFQDLIIHHYSLKTGVPYVLQAHGSFPKVMGKELLKKVYDDSFGRHLLRDASKVIALNQMEANQCLEIGVPTEKISIIPNGISLSEYVILPKKGSFKRKLGIDENYRVILYLGRLHKTKGIDILIEAFDRLLKNSHAENLVLVIVGPDDGFLAQIQSMISSLGIGGKVILAGALYGTEKVEAYVDADVYVLPSRYEMFPLTVLEAIACGVPIVLSQKCGFADVIKDEVGLVVELSANELEKAIFQITSDKQLWETFHCNCKQLAKQYDLPIVTSQLELIYKQFTL